MLLLIVVTVNKLFDSFFAGKLCSVDEIARVLLQVAELLHVVAESELQPNLLFSQSTKIV
jgi:hypothetical protein